MAFNHILFDEASQYGRKLRAALSAMENADDQQADARDCLLQMIDGDGTQDSHFGEVVKRYGVGEYTPTQGNPTAGQLTLAHNLWLEVDSASAKTSGNGSVSNVRAARDQLFAKLR